jgi:hypothetical protein
MTEKSYQEAVQVLRDRVGSRLEGVEVEGRNEMVKILRSELGYNQKAAHGAVDAMIRTGQLHYHQPIAQRHTSAPVERDDTPVVPIVSTGASVAMPGAQSGAPVPAVGVFTPGYWQIGREDSGTVTGRAGQVIPH